MHSKLELLFDSSLASSLLASLPVLRSSTSLVPKLATRGEHSILSFAHLFLFNWLLNNVDGVLKFIDVEEHGLDALKAVKRNLVDNFLVLLNLFLKELAHKT